MFEKKIFLITGGTGSFGQNMTKHLLNFTKAKQIRVFSRDEEKQDRMRHNFNDDRIKYYIGDVRNYESVDEAMRDVDYVFHAAALKQVPSCEFYPMEAVATNVIGANNVIKAAMRNCVKNLVVLSTDKAVQPINAMGMSKALMEKLMVANARVLNKEDNTILAATRYGNVMASRGSVIPLFIKQCKEHQPITVTDPNMTRFLMSLDESVQLVLFAFQHAQNGDIFVQKAPAATIYNLACAIRELFNSKTEIRVIGTRHGEKQHETLIGQHEMRVAVDMGHFFRIPSDNRDLNYDRYFTKGDSELINYREYTSENTTRLGVEEVMKKLMSLEYVQKELESKEYVGVAK